MRNCRCPPLGVAPFAYSVDDRVAVPRRLSSRLSTTHVVRLPRQNRSSTLVGSAHAVSGHVANQSFCRGYALSSRLRRYGSEPRVNAAGEARCSLYLSICIRPDSLSLSPSVRRVVLHFALSLFLSLSSSINGL
jgi:hypothetical protein